MNEPLRATIAVRQLPHAEGLPLPGYATAGAAGLDVVAAIETDVLIPPLGRSAIATGLEMAVPMGYEVQVRARSGRALREGLALVNAPGTIDSDFRGEVKVIVINLGSEPIVIRRGERIAQLVVCPIVVATVQPVQVLPESERGAGGFGSTGR
jgi:dUTP pyrophosphatase